MKNLKVGHFTSFEHGTGLSVFLFEEGAVGAYQICGSGAASHELVALDPDASAPNCHGLMLTGGSAFGLFAAKGVMQYLTERKIGLALPHGVVPIVPAAAIYDLAYKKPEPPTEKDAYQACLSATENNAKTGLIGAGTGATVGKIIPDAKRMMGGLGYAELTLEKGVQVLAYVVANAIGDIYDETHHIIAGAKDENGKFANCEEYLISGKGENEFFRRSNTTLAAVFTNAKLSKTELKRVAKMAIAGIARAISPIFTCYDGDTLFAVSLGEERASVLTIGTMAAKVVQLAILEAVKHSEVIS